MGVKSRHCPRALFNNAQSHRLELNFEESQCLKFIKAFFPLPLRAGCSCPNLYVRPISQ
jgi:hypothetical protein